ncbi:MAG: membrane protein insertion efficiency factor YidD [Acidobacteria bacterium]|nr:membrane protein insertion efficiency factor YidD [Acidobacteriota bacterium]
MGHCHSPAQLGGHRAVCADRARAARLAGQRAEVDGRTPAAARRRDLSARLLLIGVRAYQLVLGPFLGGACRFYPSCSHYAIEAIERHGARRGAALVAKRLLRCRPFSPGGVDLVPERADLPGESREAAL